jgi:hypothetical protein
MDYLALVNRAKLESGRSGGDLGSVSTATGDDLRLVKWTAAAYEKIQRKTDEWRWMRATVLASIPAAQLAHAPAVDMLIQPGDTLALADFRGFRAPSDDYTVTILDPANPAAEWNLTWLDYDEFRKRFMVGTHDEAPPVNWSVSPDNKLLVGPTPDILYHVRFDYRTKVVALTDDTDEPTMPEDYHMVIVWETLKSLASFDAASEVYARANEEFNELYEDLWTDQGPKIVINARPLA